MNKTKNHHVILTKHGEDIYINETTIKSQYQDEMGRIENVVIITGNLEPNDHLKLTQSEIVELRDILEILIEKERNRIGGDKNWGLQSIRKCNSQ